jgi:hypothetical protein
MAEHGDAGGSIVTAKWSCITGDRGKTPTMSVDGVPTQPH